MAVEIGIEYKDLCPHLIQMWARSILLFAPLTVNSESITSEEARCGVGGNNVKAEVNTDPTNTKTVKIEVSCSGCPWVATGFKKILKINLGS